MNLYTECITSNKIVSVFNSRMKHKALDLYRLNKRVMETIDAPDAHTASVPHQVASYDEAYHMIRLGAMSHDIMLHGIERCKAGVKASDIDNIVFEACMAHGVFPGMMNYENFPKTTSVNINDVIAHKLPYVTDVLKKGDVVTVDFVTYHNGVFCDMARTVEVGGGIRSSGTVKSLVNTARECLSSAIAICKPGARFSKIGFVIEKIANEHGFRVVPHLNSHFILNSIHGDIIQNVHNVNDHRIMEPGMTFTIEPLIMLPGAQLRVENDTGIAEYYKTSDGSPSAHFEDTIMITEAGAQVLTREL